MIKFASFISYLSCRFNCSMDSQDIETIQSAVKSCYDPVRVNLTAMIDAITSNRKIEAIKEYRALTGEGLLESKNAIERIMKVLPL